MADEDHSVAFWSSVAGTFAAVPGVVYDLFNEPFVGGWDPSLSDWGCWRDGCQASFTPAGAVSPVSYATAGMQQLVDAVRGAGAGQPIMLGGLAWAGDPCGLDDLGGNGGTCSWTAYAPHDPLGQLVASFHTYDFTDCTSATCWNQDVAPLAAHVPVVTGEFGEEDCSSSYIDTYMNWADANGVSYLGWGWTPDSSHATSCQPAPFGSQGGSGNNLDYLSGWNAQPDAYAPEGAAVRSHFLSLDTTPF